MKVMFLVGLPASGKTTFSKAYCEKNKDWVRVNRDDLRNMRGKYWLPKQESLISDWEQEIIATALEHKKNVIVDATNLNEKYIKEIKEICKLVDKDVEFETKFFDVSLEECIKRDLKRPNSVGEKVIRNMYNKYLNTNKPIKQDKSLPHAVICDLDGTLCIHNGRSPFEYDKCDTDLINETVKKILLRYTEAKNISNPIIYMSGREDSCIEKSIKWLEDAELFDPSLDKIFMRKTGDHRKDCIVKKELFDEHIKDKYYVEFILDDRDQVVKMWRDLGLTCLQVAEGDF